MASKPSCIRTKVRDIHEENLMIAQALFDRYAADITPEQKDALLDVIRANPHAQISPEIRRELVSSVARGEARPDMTMDIDMR